ncbi:substrate-binding domain-containing protein [Paractinoplanes durhamensis]|uniref:substrate-binding domain-containing protein n=1 Tax=Paractinoplanes durhamensis TaxID=113563 RepID=UPI00363FCADA
MPGRHRHLQRTGLVVTAAALSIAVITGGAWAGYHELSGKKCTAPVKLQVAAAAEIAPAIKTTADAWTKKDGSCVTVAVTAAGPAEMAAAIGQRHGVSLEGVGSGKLDPSGIDAWIPDSSTWLLRLASEAPGFVPTSLGSVAVSPIVLAVPEPAAKTLGWPAKTPALPDLVKRIAADKTLRAGIVDPGRDATGLGGLLAVAGAAGTGTSAATLKVGAMRALAANSSSIRSDMTQKFGTTVGLAPLSEADVIDYNRSGPETPLAALYPQPASVVLDYPFAVMPGVDPEKAKAATGLRTALASAAFVAELARAGVRGPGGEAGAGFATPENAPAAIPPVATRDPKVVTAAITQLLGSWTAITQPGRMLAVFDVSESMKATVPTAGGLTRAQLTQGWRDRAWRCWTTAGRSATGRSRQTWWASAPGWRTCRSPRARQNVPRC